MCLSSQSSRLECDTFPAIGGFSLAHFVYEALITGNIGL